MSAREHLAAIPQFQGVDLSRLTIEPLTSLTNRSYRVSAGAEHYVLRIQGPGTEHFVDRRREHHNTISAARAGLGPELLWADTQSGVMLTRFLDGTRPLQAGDFAAPTTLEDVAALLRRVHTAARPFTGRLDPSAAFESYLEAADRRGSVHAESLLILRENSAHLRRALEHGTQWAEVVPCHVDPVPANFLAAGTRLWLVDWEFSAMADPMWDLACTSLEADLSDNQRTRFLLHYFGTLTPTVNARFHEHLLMVSAVSLAWVCLQLALFRSDVDFESHYARGFRRLTTLISLAENLGLSRARSRRSGRA